MNTTTTARGHHLETEAYWYSIVNYDVSNRRLVAQFDGNGGISKYAVAGEWQLLTEREWFTAWSVNGRRLPAKHRKTVRVLGRAMEIDFGSAEALDGVAVTAVQYCDDHNNALYLRFRFANHGTRPARILLRQGMQWELKSYVAAIVAKQGTYTEAPMQDTWTEDHTGWEAVFGDSYRVHLATSHSASRIEQDGPRMVLDYPDEVAPGQEIVMTVAVSGGLQPMPLDELRSGADAAWQAAQQYRQWLSGSFSAPGHETLDALVAACLNVSDSMYKESGGTFAAFYAGVNYQSPSRTYFRDGYWTVLPLLPFKPEWVRNEIVTLAHGIGEDGSCPSAVIYNVLRERYEQFWPDHYDSPSFFILMLHDYLAWTHDKGLLQESVGGRSIEVLMELCMTKMNNLIDDELQLMVKPDNRHDWCDNVVRQGSVAYTALLHLRARFCYGEIRLFAGSWEADAHAAWTRETDELTRALRKRLWRDETGYRNYDNTAGEEAQEDNISVEQALAPAFGIGEQDDQQHVLDLITARLESRNNPDQPFGDWGVMTVFPQYTHIQHLVEKSSYPFRYHNGSDWPYWSGVLAMAKLRLRRDDWEYPLTRWFTYGLERQWLTPVEYYDPVYGKGSDLQGWSGMPAAAVLMGGLGLVPPLNGEMTPVEPLWGDTTVRGIRFRGRSYTYRAADGEVSFTAE
ncbi:hypothetical protein [Paenibacillus sp. 1P07SE]|uniref:hypothetical protein n=1 Tax=Paenibacillus sp. 1P07SE TaxID=3132209 RepID=UPI0039A412CC